MGYAWYVSSQFCFKVFVGIVFGNGHIHGEVTYTEDFEAINNILLLAMKIVEFIFYKMFISTNIYMPIQKILVAIITFVK